MKKKRGPKFERKQGGVYGRVWRKERKGGNVIILEPQKIKEIIKKQKGMCGQQM